MASTVASPTLPYPTSSPSPGPGILLNPYVNSAGRSPRYGHNASLPLPPISEPRSSKLSAVNSPGVRGPSLPLPRNDSGSSTNSAEDDTSIPGTHSRTNSIRKIRFAPLPIPRALEEAELAQMESPFTTMNEDEGLPAGAGSISSAGILGLFGANPDDNNTDTASEAGGTIKSITSATKSKSKHWSKRLLKPLLKSEKSGSTSDDALWRSPSRDSVQSNTSNEGSPQMRRMNLDGRTRHSSIGSAAGGTPLARVQSANKPRRQRMLNGRMYGVKHTGFQNIKDEEPAFVEWGHGGAGSVNNRHGAGSSKYAGVQSGEKVSIGAVASPTNSVAGGDEDDGSGMAWLRRRREQRERERQEQEEREREKTRTDSTTTTSSITSEESEKNVLEMVPSPGVMGVTAGGTPSEMPEEHHIVTAIQLPAPPHIHGHPQTHTHVQSHDTSEKPAVPSSQSNQSSSDSSDDEEDESDTEGDDEDEEDDDEDEEENERRKTALGAGVEKVSRHKEE